MVATLKLRASATIMKKWEYKVIQLDRKELESHLNQLGEEGWELLGIDYNFLAGQSFGIAKREKSE